ncbi:MAG: phage major capsid protein, P2 family [Thiotrichales bacterium]|nr:phage major capsid protein, P2 family [Thiotrichales bacterium]
MREETRVKVNALHAAMAHAYAVSDPTTKFNVTPNGAQKIIESVKEQSTFLGRINVVPVTEQSGNAIGLDVTGLIAGRTDTSANDRTPSDAHSTTGNTYTCSKVEFDTYVSYATLDGWALQPNFRTKLNNQTRKQIALNQIMIGFHGQTVATQTDPVANPNGEDVSEGWIAKVKNRRPAQYLTEGGTVGEIHFGAGTETDYLNLDLMVSDLLQLIDPAHAESGDLVVIVGHELLAYEKNKFYTDHGNTPSEKAKIEERQVIGTYGGLPAYKVPHFPARGLMITSFSNLSIYIQDSSIRRQNVDNPKRDRYETFYSMNMDYVLEDLGKAVAIEAANVKFYSGTAWTA